MDSLHGQVHELSEWAESKGVAAFYTQITTRSGEDTDIFGYVSDLVPYTQAYLSYSNRTVSLGVLFMDTRYEGYDVWPDAWSQAWNRQAKIRQEGGRLLNWTCDSVQAVQGRG